jgi:hypothetical protein
MSKLVLTSLVGFVVMLVGSACAKARASSDTDVAAEEAPVDVAAERAARRAIYDAAIAAHDAVTPESAALARAELLSQKPACIADELEWNRFEDVSLCTTACGSNDDCLPEDRCTVFPDDVAADGVTPLFEVEMKDGTLAAGLCDPFWQDLAQHQDDPILVE